MLRIVLIDWDRNPIPDAKIRLEYRGKAKVVTSRINGSLPDIVTKTPEDDVTISIMRPDTSWEVIAKVRSGWGNKLVTLRSPKLKIVSETRPHPKDLNGNPAPDLSRQKASPSPVLSLPVIPKATRAEGNPQANFGDGKGPKAEDTVSSHGLPVVKITNDQAEFDFLRGYTGEKITEADYVKAAGKIGCDVAAIKAVAEVESRGGAFDRCNRPIILYERHVFARCTKPEGTFDRENYDVSALHKPYKRANKKNQMLIKEGKLSSCEVYGNSYSRLAKAYALDKAAALKACSWGKFQILGENHWAAGYRTVRLFVEAMCQSEKNHLNAFVGFIMSSEKRRNALASKNWSSFARHYNGKKYARFRYHIKMQEAYERYAKTPMCSNHSPGCK